MNDNRSLFPDGESSAVARGSPVLSGKQRAFYEVLSRLDGRLADMYLGVLWVLAQESNPDRVCQAAHSMRELMEKLPQYLELPIPKNPTTLGDRIRSLHARWKRVERLPGGIISTNGLLWCFLKELGLFFNDFEHGHTTQREASVILVNELDPAGLPVPKVVQRERADLWQTLRDYFVKVSHHRTNQDVAEMTDRIDAVEGFLLDYLRPRTLDNQAEILSLIREGEGDGHP